MRKTVERLALAMAVLGGAVLTALVLVTGLSVLGRGMNSLAHSGLLGAGDAGLAGWLARFGPITGDFELVEAGVAFAVFAFLPWCQLRAGHATVDIFTARLPARANMALMVLWDVVFAAALILIAWRLGAGMEGKMRNGETTYLLQFPVWWAYACSLFGATVAALVALWVAGARSFTLLTGRPVLAIPGQGGGH